MLKNKESLKKRLNRIGLSLDVYKTKPNKFIRINPRYPIRIEDLEGGLQNSFGIRVKFYKTKIDGIFESSNPDIGGRIRNRTNTFFNRNYFIQDYASVICVKELELKEGQSLLETCAARGFKSILAHDSTGGKIKITALDNDPQKYKKMLKFFKEFGIKSKTQLIDSTKYRGPLFDRVLVDAPCSAEGMTVVYDEKLKKDVSGLDYVLEYSQEDVERFSDLQGRLLQNGFNHLKKSGILIYATCTLNDIENEGVVREFLKRNKEASIVKPNIRKYGVKFNLSDYGVRLLPGKTKGFFFAKIKKR